MSVADCSARNRAQTRVAPTDASCQPPEALARLRGAFERFGDDAAGYLLDEHVDRVGDTLDAGFAQLGEDPLSTDDLALSVLARATWLDRLGELGRYHRAQVRDAVMRQALGRMDGASLRREMRELSGRSRSRADRLHHDALIGYSRAVQAEKAQALGFEYFEYFGPVDTVTRDFCRARGAGLHARRDRPHGQRALARRHADRRGPPMSAPLAAGAAGLVLR